MTASFFFLFKMAKNLVYTFSHSLGRLEDFLFIDRKGEFS